MKLLRDQLAYLRDRAEAIANGAQKLDGTLRQRATLYANAAKSAFWQTVAKVKGEDDATECRRVLSGGESCPDCIQYAAMGWQPNDGTLPSPGEGSVCRSNCQCVMEFR